MPLPGLLWECISTRHPKIHPHGHQKPGSGCFTACESMFPYQIFSHPSSSPSFLLIQQHGWFTSEREHPWKIAACLWERRIKVGALQGDGDGVSSSSSLLGPRATLCVTGRVTLRFFACINCSSRTLMCRCGSTFPWCRMGCINSSLLLNSITYIYFLAKLTSVFGFFF